MLIFAMLASVFFGLWMKERAKRCECELRAERVKRYGVDSA